MKRFGNLATPWWLGGVALAAVGVILVRIAAPFWGGAARPIAEIAGHLLALGGLTLIAVGVSRRVHRSSSP
jgi:drug/metabolite transporter (DMT)-like permease